MYHLAHLSLGITDRFWILCNVLYNIEEIIFITFYIDDENQVIRELVLFLQNQRKLHGSARFTRHALEINMGIVFYPEMRKHVRQKCSETAISHFS